jgi:uncharacterized protein
MRVAALADLHCTTESRGEIRRMVEGVESSADVLVMAGDLTNVGLAAEMQVLLDELDHLSLPKVAVTGNHDHEGSQIETLVAMMRTAGWHVLDGDAWERDGVGFIGTKGFCGGFGDRRLMPFGEPLIKTFIQASIDEAARLEDALSRLETRHKVAVLHYAPIAGTLLGEDPQIYPFLGYSRLGDALDRYGADLIVHGHAHGGVPVGSTPGGIPVYNVSRYVLRRAGRGDYALLDV